MIDHYVISDREMIQPRPLRHVEREMSDLNTWGASAVEARIGRR